VLEERQMTRITCLTRRDYLQDKEPPGNKKAIVEAVLASRPMPRSNQWVEVDKVVVATLTSTGEVTVSVREGLQDIDRTVITLTGKK